MRNHAGIILPGFTGAASLGPCLQSYTSFASQQAGREEIVLEANGCLRAGQEIRTEGAGLDENRLAAENQALAGAVQRAVDQCPPPFCNLEVIFAEGRGCTQVEGLWSCSAIFSGFCVEVVPPPPPEIPEIIVVPEIPTVPVPVPANGTTPVPTDGVGDTLLTVLKFLGFVVILVVGTIIFVKVAPALVAAAGTLFGAVGTALAKAATAAAAEKATAAAAAAGFTIVFVAEDE